MRLKYRTGRWRQRAWWTDGILQLQRRAFEGIGIKGWELDEWDRVPVTEKGKVFSATRNWEEMLPISIGRTKGLTATTTEGQEKNAVVKVDSKFTLGKQQSWSGDSPNSV